MTFVRPGCASPREGGARFSPETMLPGYDSVSARLRAETRRLAAAASPCETTEVSAAPTATLLLPTRGGVICGAVTASDRGAFGEELHRVGQPGDGDGEGSFPACRDDFRPVGNGRRLPACTPVFRQCTGGEGGRRAPERRRAQRRSRGRPRRTEACKHAYRAGGDRGFASAGPRLPGAGL